MVPAARPVAGEFFNGLLDDETCNALRKQVESGQNDLRDAKEKIRALEENNAKLSAEMKLEIERHNDLKFKYAGALGLRKALIEELLVHDPKSPLMVDASVIDRVIEAGARAFDYSGIDEDGKQVKPRNYDQARLGARQEAERLRSEAQCMEIAFGAALREGVRQLHYIMGEFGDGDGEPQALQVMELSTPFQNNLNAANAALRSLFTGEPIVGFSEDVQKIGRDIWSTLSTPEFRALVREIGLHPELYEPTYNDKPYTVNDQMFSQSRWLAHTGIALAARELSRANLYWTAPWDKNFLVPRDLEQAVAQAQQRLSTHSTTPSITAEEHVS